ncbi:Ribosome production factor 2 -like protein [Takifugu flavidus]|uniref:Ribosome production factor 2 homolog n=1 Tax=Takifugu flavidus TaxID=433684 RepID=A0A5C6NS10_9TELE|nr:Ribosome production factor 2 -like protein [Takifugu flavidus]
MPLGTKELNPKTKRSKRFLESRAPKLVEDGKSAMIMKGGNTSQLISNVLKDIGHVRVTTEAECRVLSLAGAVLCGMWGASAPRCFVTSCQHLLELNIMPAMWKNITRPFEDSTSLEFFSKKTDCSLFLFGSHSKKRPDNLILGRLFDFHVLDMIELGIEKFSSLSDIKQLLPVLLVCSISNIS